MENAIFLQSVQSFLANAFSISAVRRMGLDVQASVDLEGLKKLRTMPEVSGHLGNDAA